MSSTARVSERGISAPSRRSVVRAAAWTAPAVSIAVAAPAYAACSPNTANVSGVLDWDAAAGLAWSRAQNRQSATATYTRAGAAPLTLTLSAAFLESMKVGSEDGTSNMNYDRPAQVGGLGMGGLTLHQSNTRDNPRNINGKGKENDRRLDRGVYTFTFDRAVKNLSFYITDIDSTTGDFRDAIELSTGFGVVSKATAIAGTGIATDPFRTNTSNAPADNATSGAGNIRVTYGGPITSFTVDYWNIQDSFTRDTDQAAFISDLTFTYSPQVGCAPR